jgi:hypothetical protein
LHVNDLSKRILCVISDAYSRRLSVNKHPLMTS